MRGGFTLIEALAAFVILAVVMVVLQRGLVVFAAGAHRAEDWGTAERVARTLLASGTDGISLASPELSGTTDGHPWTIAAEPLPFAPAAIERPDGTTQLHVPVRLRLSVRIGTNGTLDVETVRIVRADGP